MDNNGVARIVDVVFSYSFQNAVDIISCSNLEILYLAAIVLQPLTVFFTQSTIRIAFLFSSLKYPATSIARSKLSELSVSEILSFNPVPVSTGFMSKAGERIQPLPVNRNP